MKPLMVSGRTVTLTGQCPSSSHTPSGHPPLTPLIHIFKMVPIKLSCWQTQPMRHHKLHYATSKLSVPNLSLQSIVIGATEAEFRMNRKLSSLDADTHHPRHKTWTFALSSPPVAMYRHLIPHSALGQSTTQLLSTSRSPLIFDKIMPI